MVNPGPSTNFLLNKRKKSLNYVFKFNEVLENKLLVPLD
jgi:hypothetical protein